MSILDEINALNINEAEKPVVCTLRFQLNQAKNNTWMRRDLSRLIKTDNDVLDTGLVAEESQLWADIRDIQDGIICCYSED